MKNIKVRLFLAGTNQDLKKNSEFTEFLGHSGTCNKAVGFSCPIHLPGSFTTNSSCGIFVSKQLFSHDDCLSKIASSHQSTDYTAADNIITVFHIYYD